MYNNGNTKSSTGQIECDIAGVVRMLRMFVGISLMQGTTWSVKVVADDQFEGSSYRKPPEQGGFH